MKIIDVLTGKETPKKFKYNTGTFERQNNGDYIDEDGDNLTAWIFSDYSNIYDEIKIIEEDKEIEKINYYATNRVKNEFAVDYIENGETKKFCLNKKQRYFADKINELIDKINNMEDNK